MRKFNSYLVKLILVLLVAHALLGAFSLLHLTTWHASYLSYALLGACLAHAAIGIYLTLPAMRQSLRTHTWYLPANSSYWIIRASGLVILLLVGFHMTAFSTTINGLLFLREFTWLRLLTQIIFISAILIHLLYTVKPMLLQDGILSFRETAAAYIVVYSIISLFCIVAMLSYFIYWNL